MAPRQVGTLERYVVLGLILLFAALAAVSFIKSFVNPNYHPDAALTGIAVSVVGAAVTHLLVSGRGRRNGGNGDG